MTDLHLSSGQYSLVIIIFFISYILFEIPGNLILSRTRPSVYLSTTMVLWGAVACCMGAVKNTNSLLAVRFVLGILEAGFPPGVSLMLSSWYKKDEQAKRFSIFYSAAVLSGAFGGIIAGAITGSLDGAHGIAGWRWLFVCCAHCLIKKRNFINQTDRSSKVQQQWRVRSFQCSSSPISRRPPSAFLSAKGSSPLND